MGRKYSKLYFIFLSEAFDFLSEYNMLVVEFTIA